MATNGIHHLALATNDMKAQIEFFTQIVGMKLVALFPMHGAEGSSHCFIEAGKNCYLSFVQIAGAHIDPVIGVSHAHDGLSPVAGGAMQHLSFNVDTLEELLDLRDSIRSHNYAVVGPFDHGLSQSMYLGAPEGILLEFATSDGCKPIDPARWVDPTTAARFHMSRDDLQRYVSPKPLAGRGGVVEQPSPETSVYPSPIPRAMFNAIGHLSDAELRQAISYPEPVPAQ